MFALRPFLGVTAEMHLGKVREALGHAKHALQRPKNNNRPSSFKWILCLFAGFLARSSSAPLTRFEEALSSFRQELAPRDAARLRIVVAGKARELDSAVQDQLFLAICEALTNALRHSQAANIEVEIEYLSGRLRAAVRDNGIGIDPELLHDRRKSHAGLTCMCERAQHIGAQVRLWSKAGAGAEVEISCPFNRSAVRAMRPRT